MDTRVHFSSQTDLWATPQELFDRLNKFWLFTTDVCAVAENAKCERYFSPAEDGLKQHWTGTCWMNPPYGREIGKWVKKAFDSAAMGATVVCLLPARVDTVWWHNYAKKGEVEFLRGRLKFGGHKNSAPFPSAIVVFVGGLIGWRLQTQTQDVGLLAKPIHLRDGIVPAPIKNRKTQSRSSRRGNFLGEAKRVSTMPADFASWDKLERYLRLETSATDATVEAARTVWDGFVLAEFDRAVMRGSEL